MAVTTTNTTSGSGCVLWTPWGPQSATEGKPQRTSLRRTLHKLTAPKVRKQVRDLHYAKPECAYEP
ncbi:MAG: hypothetical protein KF874_07380 [Rhizobiaceae bacterium]|nr:hypothetical protein [Rhizobiaceae bacterium]